MKKEKNRKFTLEQLEKKKKILKIICIITIITEGTITILGIIMAKLGHTNQAVICIISMFLCMIISVISTLLIENSVKKY